MFANVMHIQLVCGRCEASEGCWKSGLCVSLSVSMGSAGWDVQLLYVPSGRVTMAVADHVAGTC